MSQTVFLVSEPYEGCWDRVFATYEAAYAYVHRLDDANYTAKAKVIEREIEE